MKAVYVFFANGFEEIEALTAVDVLKRAGLNVKMISVTDEETVLGAHEIPVICDAKFDECQFDNALMLLLPGGMPGAANLDKHEGLHALIQQFIENTLPIAAICAAPFILGKQGYLNEKRVTCYPGFEQYLIGANVTGAQVEQDGNITTAIGPGAAMSFALTLVEFLLGKEKAIEMAENMFVK